MATVKKVGGIKEYEVNSISAANLERYKGVSKSPSTMLITRKSLVFHEFPARVCCGGVL
jgi:hypothetical protein